MWSGAYFVNFHYLGGGDFNFVGHFPDLNPDDVRALLRGGSPDEDKNDWLHRTIAQYGHGLRLGFLRHRC